MSQYHPSENWFKFLLDRDQLNPATIQPQFYEIDVTNKCNLNCFHGKCCSALERSRPTVFMNMGIFTRILISATYNNIGIVFTGGGEPTEHPDLIRFVQMATSFVAKPFMRFDRITQISDYIPGIALVTNGTHLDVIDKIANIMFGNMDETKLTHYPGLHNAWIRISLNERPVTKLLKDLLEKYPKKIGISMVYCNEDERLTMEEKRSDLTNAKFIRIEPLNELTIQSKTQTPERCIGRLFVKIFNPYGEEQYCCLARGLHGEPPAFCVKDCRWEPVDLDKIWDWNPFT